MISLEDEICDVLEARVIKELPSDKQVISSSCGKYYEIDNGDRRIFVKKCGGEMSRMILDGEFLSLKTMENTQTVRVPKPYAVINNPEDLGCVLIMEMVDEFKPLNGSDDKLGEKVAKMHFHNYYNIRSVEKARSWASKSYNELEDQCVRSFGFDTPTFNDKFEQNNSWTEDWIEFFARHRLQAQMEEINSYYGDRECLEQWSALSRHLDKLFMDKDGKIIPIYPSLLHGQLWTKHVGQTVDNEPVVINPASFYGHSEYDLVVGSVLGAFDLSFYENYDKIIKKQAQHEIRQELYKLYLHMNQWNQLGAKYRPEVISSFKTLNKYLNSKWSNYV